MPDHPRQVRLRVGRNVRYLRRLRALSQERLAELSGSSHKQIGRIERGEVNVTIDILTAIATSLAIKVGDLFEHTADAEACAPSRAEWEQVEQAFQAIDRVRDRWRRALTPRKPR